MKGIHFEKCATLVLDLVFPGRMFGKAGQKFGKDYARKEVRKIMPSWRLLKTKDTAHQGCLNLQNIEALWKTEDLDNYESGVIVSKYVVWREGNKFLVNVGYPLFTPAHTDHELGEKRFCI